MKPFRLAALSGLFGAIAAAGSAASPFGDWRADAPGVVHHIAPADLPEPFATSSAANAPRVIARPPGALPKTPPGFVVSLFAEGLNEPRAIRVAPDGGVFVAESGAGRVLLFRGGKPHVFAAGLDLPYGIAFFPPGPRPAFVYIAETDRLVRYPYRSEMLRAAGPPEVIVSHLPSGGHWTRDIAFAPDGTRLFLAVGSASNLAQGIGAPPAPLPEFEASHGRGAAWGFEEGRAQVLVLDPLGKTMRAYATGLRNCSGLTVQPATGEPWCAVNERDALGDNLPPDFVTHLEDGAFYGWPWFYIGPHPDPRWHGERADLRNAVRLPDVLLQPHSAPLGIVFYQGRSFPAEYQGGAFVALHGSWNRSLWTGYKVVFLPMRNGRAGGDYIDFLTGFVTEQGVWGRPVGVAVDAEGALLVSEDANGTIWRIAPAAPR